MTRQESNRDKAMRLWQWAHRRFTAAYHTAADDRTQRMAEASGVYRRVVPIAVKYGILHRDSLERWSK